MEVHNAKADSDAEAYAARLARAKDLADLVVMIPDGAYKCYPLGSLPVSSLHDYLPAMLTAFLAYCWKYCVCLASQTLLIHIERQDAPTPEALEVIGECETRLEHLLNTLRKLGAAYPRLGEL